MGSVANQGTIGNEAGQVGGSQQQGNEIVNHATLVTPEAKPVPGPKSFQEQLPNDVLLEMVYIPEGNFLMGSPEDEEGRDVYQAWNKSLTNVEGPQHQVTVPAFYLGKYLVTQAQWRAIAGMPQIKRRLEPDPSNFKGDNRPVEYVSWDDAVEFCKRLSRHSGKQYRLPSESQWEYACRAHTTTPFYFGETISTKQANYDGNYTYGDGKKGQYWKQTTDVGSFPPNKFRLYDMHGNVWEWCEDIWHDSYEGAPSDGTAWTEGISNNRLLRGGSWGINPGDCRSAFRDLGSRNYHDDRIGFRVCCVPPFA